MEMTKQLFINKQSIMRKGEIPKNQYDQQYQWTYSKHWELSIIVKESLLFPQLLILTQAPAEEVSDAGVVCQH